MDYSATFRVKPGSNVSLDRIDPSFEGKHESKESAEQETAQSAQKLRELQFLMYAENKRSLLICLQAMDAGGKDGTINHVLGAMNPQGCRVEGFKTPSAEEASHDFLWRIHKDTPARGRVAIFNRSHYEDVLVARVHELVPKEVWERRYGEINHFEKQLAENGMHILKFFLHISEDEQLRRFKQRLDDPARHWKMSENDYTEREYWPQYMKAFQEALAKTSTDYAPWFIIPSNHKWFRNLAVSKIVVEPLESLKMKVPAPTVDIKEIARKYHQAEKEVKKEKR